MTDLHMTFTITGISQISTLNTATPPQNNPPRAFAHLASAPRARCQPPDLTPVHLVWCSGFNMIPAGLEPQIQRRRKGKRWTKLKFLLSFAIQHYTTVSNLCFWFFLQRSCRSPGPPLAFQTELLQDRMSAFIAGSPREKWNGFPEMLWKHCWGANQGKIVSLKPKAWTNRKLQESMCSHAKNHRIYVFRKFQKHTNSCPNPSSRPFSPAGSPFRCSKAPCVVFQAAHVGEMQHVA